MDPATGILVGKAIADSLGGLFAPKDPNKKDRQETAREFDERNLLDRQRQAMDQVGNINDLERQRQLGSLRDKVSYMLNARAGMVPQSFHPNDMFNPGNGAPQQGGIDPAQLQGAMSSYHAPDFNGGTFARGSGGVDPRIYGQMMAKLGYAGNQLGEIIPTETLRERNGVGSPAVPYGGPGTTEMPNGGQAQQGGGVGVYGPGGKNGWGSMPGGRPAMAPPPPPPSPSIDPAMLTRRTRRY